MCTEPRGRRSRLAGQLSGQGMPMGFSPPTLHSSQPRFLVILNLLVLLPGGVYMNSVTYAPLHQGSQRAMRFRLDFWTSALYRSPTEVLVMCTVEPSMIRWFASNVCGRAFPIVKCLSECVIDDVASPVLHTHEGHRCSIERP